MTESAKTFRAAGLMLLLFLALAACCAAVR